MDGKGIFGIRYNGGLMVKIDYAQEKMSKINFVIPGIFLVVGIIMIITGYQEKGNSAVFLRETLIPALALIVFDIICFCVLMKQSIKKRDDIIRIKEKGYRIDGQVLKVNTYTYTERTHGRSHESYYYTFTVKYKDLLSGKEIMKESIRTFIYYELLSNSCVLRVLNDEVLVESVYAVEHRGHWSKKDIIMVVAFLALISVLILIIVLPILGTL